MRSIATPLRPISPIRGGTTRPKSLAPQEAFYQVRSHVSVWYNTVGESAVGESAPAVCGSSGGGARQLCAVPVNFCHLAQIDTQPEGSLGDAPPTPAPSRRVRLTLCDSPRLSESRRRPFVAHRAAVPGSCVLCPSIFATWHRLTPSLRARWFECSCDASTQQACDLCEKEAPLRLPSASFEFTNVVMVSTCILCTDCRVPLGIRIWR